jgi:hypothetical protein
MKLTYRLNKWKFIQYELPEDPPKCKNKHLY